MPEHADESAVAPKRILILSANMGEGHNATGRALHAAAARLWPEASIQWRDALDIMGRGVGPLFRWIYVANVERTPWLYQFFYDLVWRYPWFARASKRFVGAWCGWRLATEIDRIHPDLILSTYPLGTAGLDWLRQHRGLAARIGAWVSDFAPHPFWVYEHIDLNLVMHEVAVPVASASAPGAKLAVSALTVDARFTPGDRKAARAESGLPQEGFVFLVSCGSLGFGRTEDTIRELLDGAPSGQVVVVCGRNDTLRAKLTVLFSGDQRVIILGWTDHMATLMVACDAVVTNAGGATSLEALACGRAVLMHHPIAAHGKANAELMAKAGLALVCDQKGELAAAVGDRARLAVMEQAALIHAKARTIEQGLLSLASAQSKRLSRSLSAEDALFIHIDSPQVPQHVGAVLLLKPRADGSLLAASDIVDLLENVPGIRGQFTKGTWLRRPQWIQDDSLDLHQLVSTTDTALSEAVDSFYAKPLPSGGTGAALLVTGLSSGEAALLIKLHHALGDGIAILRALVSGTGSTAWSGSFGHRVSHALVKRPRLRGLLTLARGGSLHRGSRFDERRHVALAQLPSQQVKTIAKELNATTTELLLTLFAHACQNITDTKLRVMVPWSLRETTVARAAGNNTGGIFVDLPIEPMDPLRRLTLIQHKVQTGLKYDAPATANTVIHLFGLLPPGLYAFIAKHVYQSRWFTVIGTVLPGLQRPVTIAGSEVITAYPVLPLADGVEISWGAMAWGESITVGLTAGGSMIDQVDRIAQSMTSVLAELAAAALKDH